MSSKSSKKNKFIRHRDLKLKGSEIEYERRIQREMLQGICERCQDKLRWKFQYDKYKPLKHLGED